MRTGKTPLHRAQPLYRQLSARMEAKILSGELAAGDRLPTTPELATLFGVTVQTAQQGAALLTRRGLVERIRGRGTFVSNRITSRTLGIVCGVNVFGQTHTLFYQQLYAELSTQLKQLGWNVSLYFPSAEHSPEQMLAELEQDVGNGRLRGLIPLCSSDALADWLAEHPQLPCGERPSQAPPREDSRSDEAYRGVVYLLGRGYRRIAVVMHTETTHPELLAWTKARVAEAYAERTLPLQTLFYEGKAATHAAGVSQARAALAAAGGPPDAFLVLNDTGCMGVIFELLCRRFRIPGDIGVMAVANKGIEIPCPVELTRLEHDPADHARQAIEATLAQIEGREPEVIPIHSRLIVGKSCGE